jgi:hypothetical protein
VGIISIQERNTSSNSKACTGKHIQYRTSAKFGEILQDPYISGKFYYYTDLGDYAGGRFGAFWDTGSTEQTLTMVAGSSSWNQRTARWHSSASQNWQSFTIDISSVTSPGRLVFYAGQDDTDFNSDVDFDDIKLHAANGTEVNFDPSESSVRSNNMWQRWDSTVATTTYSGAKSNYPSSGWENVPTSRDTGLWNFVAGEGGISSGTGSDNAADNNNSTIYLFREASSGNANRSDGLSYVRWADRYDTSSGSAV